MPTARSGYDQRRKQLYEHYRGGRSFTALTAVPLSSAFAPGAWNGTLYIGSQDGVYSLTVPNAGLPSASWQRYAIGLPNVPVYNLKYVASQQLLVAGTMGRGAC